MDKKKAPQANLEHKRFTNFIIGLIVTFSLILIGFEWTSPLDIDRNLALAKDITYDIEIMEAIPRDEKQPELKEELPKIKEVIKIVPDDIILEEVDFSNEVTKNTNYDFRIIDDDAGELILDDPIPFVNVEEKPLFNGGDPITEFPRYIARNLRYPEIAAENGISGRVIVQFVIDEKGEVVDPVVLRPVDPALDAEAIRVIKTSPRWTPGKQRNKPVKVSYVFPINFVLQ
jgi:protein TonB